tara:strand:+ start:2481 stop:4571 length:2091 start_codon:yes stop_codon:yes gene_type:complete
MKRIILIFVGIVSVAYGQDAFFSNFYRSYALSNPSAIIMQDDINITALHRSQWSGIVSPFTSSQLEGYYGIRKANSNEKIGSIGFSAINERLGNHGYTRNSYSITGAYNLKIANDQHLAAGIKLGYFNSGTDLNALSTGNQFQNGYYQATNPLGENMSNPVFSGLEISPSFTWYQHDEEHHYKHYAGITLFNLNQPKLSNFNNEYKMPLRLAINAGSRVYIKNLTLLPRGMFQLQGNQSQIIGGTDVVYSLGNNQFGLGGYYRLGDAAIASFKYFSDFIDVGISYDFNTSNINNTSSSNGNSFEIFVDYKIKQEIKYKQFEVLIELFDEDTKEPLAGNGNYRNLTTKAKGKLFENKAKHYATFNEKEKIQLIFSHPEYETKKLVVTGEEGDEVNQKIYMSKLIKLFDFELEIFDKETSNPLAVDITLINQNSGDKKLLGNDSKFTTQFELGEKYTLSLDADGYDNKIVEIRYNKIGTLSKTVFVTPTKPTIETSNLILAIKDEITLESIPSTIMAINISDPVNHSSSLIALNDNPPPTFPLEVGQSYEILVTKEGYFNKTIKIDNQSKNDILQEILMTPVEIGKSIIIDDLHFKTGLTELDDDSYRLLDQLVDFMSHNSTLKVEIAGHTDSDGSEEFNQSLSEGRAQSAVNYIIEKGIDESRLVAKGYGESEPMVENDTEENKAKNRRVELKVIGK